jgi:hypothetical protein
MCLFVGVAVGIVAQGFFYPPAFPDVVLTRTDKSLVVGRLIAVENGSYYVETSGNVDIIPQLQTHAC